MKLFKRKEAVAEEIPKVSGDGLLKEYYIKNNIQFQEKPDEGDYKGSAKKPLDFSDIEISPEEVLEEIYEDVEYEVGVGETKGSTKESYKEITDGDSYDESLEEFVKSIPNTSKEDKDGGEDEDINGLESIDLPEVTELFSDNSEEIEYNVDKPTEIKGEESCKINDSVDFEVMGKVNTKFEEEENEKSVEFEISDLQDPTDIDENDSHDVLELEKEEKEMQEKKEIDTIIEKAKEILRHTEEVAEEERSTFDTKMVDKINTEVSVMREIAEERLHVVDGEEKVMNIKDDSLMRILQKAERLGKMNESLVKRNSELQESYDKVFDELQLEKKRREIKESIFKDSLDLVKNTENSSEIKDYIVNMNTMLEGRDKELKIYKEITQSVISSDRKELVEIIQGLNSKLESLKEEKAQLEIETKELKQKNAKLTEKYNRLSEEYVYQKSKDALIDIIDQVLDKSTLYYESLKENGYPKEVSEILQETNQLADINLDELTKEV